MRDIFKEFLDDTSNFQFIADRSESDLQFELGYFLRNKQKLENVRFEYQFKDFYEKDKILKKEADICVINGDAVDTCIEIKLLKENSGITNFFASCFEDICYLLQLKKGGAIGHGYFILVCASTKAIESSNSSTGSRFWKGASKINDEGNFKGTQLSDYTINDLPNETSWKHEKLRSLVKTDNALDSLAEKRIEYSYRSNKNTEYAFCIVEL